MDLIMLYRSILSCLFHRVFVPFIVILTRYKTNGATWCYACDSARDDKCYDPRQEFFTDPDDLIRSASESASLPVFSFTSASYLRTLPNGSKSMEFIEAGNRTDYCTTHSYSRWSLCDSAASPNCKKTNISSCRYRPSGLRLINCDRLLADQSGTKQCLKIKQKAGMSEVDTVEKIIRTCVAREADVPTCQRTVSIDGKTESTWCICSDSLCNAGAYIFKLDIALNHLLLPVLISVSQNWIRPINVIQQL